MMKRDKNIASSKFLMHHAADEGMRATTMNEVKFRRTYIDSHQKQEINSPKRVKKQKIGRSL